MGFRIVAAVFVFAATASLVAYPAAAQPKPAQARVLEQKWHDEARDRDVRARIYYPANSTKPMPVIIFSHGLGASRVMYSYLGKAWSAGGFVSVHLQHAGSDDELAKGKTDPFEILGIMMKAVSDDDNLINRPLDVRFAIDQLTKQNVAEASPLKGKLDMDRLGVAGHSFGAYTTLAIAGGMVTAHGKTSQMNDPRVKAGIAMSAPSSLGRLNVTLDEAYGPIAIPMMHLTGTLDSIPLVQNSGPEDRRIPFDRIFRPDQFLITFIDGDHIVLCGERVFGIAGPNDAQILKLTCQSTVAFWNAYLNDDPKAKEWLKGGGMKEALGSSAMLETKPGHPEQAK